MSRKTAPSPRTTSSKPLATFPNAKFQLYNLRTDPSETTNLFSQEPGKAMELFTALKADLARGRSR